MRVAAPTERRFVRVGIEDGELVLDAAFPRGAQDVAAGPAQSDMAPQALALLDTEPMTRAAVARALGRTKGDNTVRRTFDKLEEQGQIEQDDDGLWHGFGAGGRARPTWATPNIATTMICAHHVPKHDAADALTSLVARCSPLSPAVSVM